MKITNVEIRNGRYYYIRTKEERSPTTGRRKQKWERLTRVSEGEAAMMAVLALLLGKEPAKRSDFEATVDEFFRTAPLRLEPATLLEYRRMFVVICKGFEQFTVAQVRPADVLDFLAYFAAKPTARRAYKARLSTFFRWCVLTERIAQNPCREIALPQPPRRGAKFTAEVFHAIRDALPPRGQCMLDLLFLTGQRPTEIRLLRENQVTAAGIRFVPTKTRKSTGAEVTLPMTPAIEAVLRRARLLVRVRSLRPEDAYLFPAAGGRSPLSKTGFISMWDRAREKAGCPGVTAKDVRPFALAEAERLYGMRQAQTMGAHDLQSTTEGYVRKYRVTVADVELRLPVKGA